MNPLIPSTLVPTAIVTQQAEDALFTPHPAFILNRESMKTIFPKSSPVRRA